MDQHTYTVSELTGRLTATIDRAFPDEVWVQGEIRDLSRSQAGHVYFSLVDPGTDGRESLLPVTLFASEKYAVNHALVRSGAGRMTDGINVRIRGRLGLYAQRSTVQLRMTWIDTDYTLGQLAAKRAALVKKLTEDGSLLRNGRLPMPVLPLAVGLVTSAGSAAHADFLTELERSGYGFRVVVSHATVQGIEAPESIAGALRRLTGSQLDVVAVVRGGGAQTDLAAFDTEVVARAISDVSVPVLTGIGHETDQTVADLAAHGAHKTPTATAQAIVGAVATFVIRLDRVTVGLQRAHRTAVRRTAARMDHLAFRLRSGTQRHLDRQDMRLAGAVRSASHRTQRSVHDASRRLGAAVVRSSRLVSHRLDAAATEVESLAARAVRSGRRAVAEADQRLEALRRVAETHDPATIFARGWSITYAEDGRPIRQPDDVASGARLHTVVEGGTLSSIVVEDGDTP